MVKARTYQALDRLDHVVEEGRVGEIGRVDAESNGNLALDVVLHIVNEHMIRADIEHFGQLFAQGP